MRAIDIACVLAVGAAVTWRVAAGRSNRSRLASVAAGAAAARGRRSATEGV
jgi:hypothetical protein